MTQTAIWRVVGRAQLYGRSYQLRLSAVRDRLEWRLFDMTEDDEDHIATVQISKSEHGAISIYRQHLPLRLLRFVMDRAKLPP
jgi:hypothetical protein